MTIYAERIGEIQKELQGKTLGEVEAARNINTYDYIGVGYGYNLKGRYPKTYEEAFADTKTPELDELENSVRRQEGR
jgi:hypothetical protein